MERYESRGYRVLAPSWPGLEGEVEALNADPAPLTKLDVDKIVDHYDGIIRGLDSPPIIMGHSLGGTIVQLLLARGLPGTPVAIQAWDGGAGEAGPRMSLTSWYYLRLEEPQSNRKFVIPPVVALLTLAAMVLIVRAARSRATNT